MGGSLSADLSGWENQAQDCTQTVALREEKDLGRGRGQKVGELVSSSCWGHR